MKKNLLLSATFVAVVLVFNSCKKDKIKDYSSLFNNTVWTGNYQYPNKTPQAYGMQFKNDGSMIFISVSGEYAGTYTIDAPSKKINIAIANSVVKISAAIGDKELTGFTNITNHGYSFVSCLLNATADQNLAGTQWSMIYYYYAGAGLTDSLVEPLTFTSTSVVLGQQPPLNYTRKAGTVRFSPFFGVLEGSIMRGEVSSYTWHATKQ